MFSDLERKHKIRILITSKKSKNEGKCLLNFLKLNVDSLLLVR
jgi:hypothetical protein